MEKERMTEKKLKLALYWGASCGGREGPVLLHGDKQSAVHDISGTAVIYNSIGSLSLPKASIGLQFYLSIYELMLTLSVGICLFIMIKIIKLYIQRIGTYSR